MNREHMTDDLSDLRSLIRPRPVLRVRSASAGFAVIGGADALSLGQRLELPSISAEGEVVGFDAAGAQVVLSQAGAGLRPGDPVMPLGHADESGGAGWLGRVVDAGGRPRGGGPPPRSGPPARWRPTEGFGPPLSTGLSVFDAILPLCRGQRIGLFAGSGVGKSTLVTRLAQGVAADSVVIALVGERRREIAGLVAALPAETFERTIVVAATSDEGPLARRRCALTAIDAATSLAARGDDVLFLCDSVTRIAEAEREVAVAMGAPLGPGGHAPWTPRRLAELVERAGRGPGGAGSITAIFSVLVPGSDLEEPVADAMRGLLDGHVVLDREIAERGRFPAVDVLRSVSRAAPDALPEHAEAAVADLRRLLSAWSEAEMMLRAGLYEAGADPVLDRAIALRDRIEAFLSSPSTSPSEAAERLRAVLEGA
ncbi:MAG: flagellum-specific ATP synthase FliI [Hasllibacter sp.]